MFTEDSFVDVKTSQQVLIGRIFVKINVRRQFFTLKTTTKRSQK